MYCNSNILAVDFSSCQAQKKIKSITEFKVAKDSLVKIRKTFFDKHSRIVKNIYFGSYDPRRKTYRNRRVLISYQNGKKYKKLSCEYFVAWDKCVLRSFSKYKTDDKGRVIQEIKFEADSLIRFLRNTKYLKSKIIQTTYTWEFHPVNKINKKSALKLTTIKYLDKQNRDTLTLYYSELSSKPMKNTRSINLMVIF